MDGGEELVFLAADFVHAPDVIAQFDAALNPELNPHT